MSSPVLEVRDLRVTFEVQKSITDTIRGAKPSEAVAVDGVNLSIAPGEILAIAGESGCGKTTLARTIMGLQAKVGGSILLDGQELGSSRKVLREHRKRVQLVFQDPVGALDPRQTLYETIAEGIRVQDMPGDERERVATALSQAGLRPPEAFFERFPHEVSGGQRQRVAIAAALALEPDVLVADEPVSALDASVKGEILQLLLRLRDELGLAVLVITHDLGLAWAIADRIAIMYLGKVVELGPAEQVLSYPQHPYTEALLSVVPEAERPERIILTGEAPDPTRIPPGCRFNPRCPRLQKEPESGSPLRARCIQEMPLLHEIATGHTAACHAAD
jgi:peptide/nickel transport system ATP-binding protein